MSGTFLKCDAPGCDHMEHAAEYTAALIGKTCPKCGAVILTQEDYDNSLPFFSLMDALQDLGALADTEGPQDKGMTIVVNPHAGALSIKITPEFGT